MTRYGKRPSTKARNLYRSLWDVSAKNSTSFVRNATISRPNATKATCSFPTESQLSEHYLNHFTASCSRRLKIPAFAQNPAAPAATDKPTNPAAIASVLPKGETTAFSTACDSGFSEDDGCSCKASLSDADNPVFISLLLSSELNDESLSILSDLDAESLPLFSGLDAESFPTLSDPDNEPFPILSGLVDKSFPTLFAPDNKSFPLLSGLDDDSFPILSGSDDELFSSLSELDNELSPSLPESDDESYSPLSESDDA